MKVSEILAMLTKICWQLVTTRGSHRPESSVKEAKQEIQAAIQFHIEELREDGLPIPTTQPVWLSIPKLPLDCWLKFYTIKNGTQKMQLVKIS